MGPVWKAPFTLMEPALSAPENVVGLADTEEGGWTASVATRPPTVGRKGKGGGGGSTIKKWSRFAGWYSSLTHLDVLWRCAFMAGRGTGG